MGIEKQKRIQQSLLAPYEKKVLLYLAAKMPAWINSDHLTLLGFVAACLSGLFYYFARFDHIYLWWVNGMIFLNWFGDSLDGTLARYRNKQRPRYGYYVDHILDAIGTSAILWGMAFSGYINTNLALAVLCVYLVMSINSYLSASVFESFQISYWRFSPPVLRVLMIIGNTFIFFKPIVHILGIPYLMFNIAFLVGLLLLSIMLVFHTIKNIIILYNQER